MFTIEEICNTALQLAGRGDKPASDDFALAVRTLQAILSDWAATKDVQLWNLVDYELTINRGSVVKVGDNYYQCYITHTAAAGNEPEVGDNYLNYWVPTTSTTTYGTWTSGLTYSNGQTLSDLSGIAIEDILCPRIVFQGQTSAVEKINAIDYAKLQPNEQGVPTHLWVQKTGNGIYIRIWPVLNEESVLLRFYSVLRNEYIRPEASSNLPDYWSQALYYALALELGFMYNIGIERINLLGQKAVHEFNKAFRANASEVDRCFVKPCY